MLSVHLDYDFDAKLTEFMYSFVGNGTGVPKVQKFFTSRLACPAASRTDGCLRERSLPRAIVNTTLELGGGIAVLNLALGSLGAAASGALSVAGGLAFLPVVISRTYNMSLFCFVRMPPPLPVCLFDDMYDVVDTYILARHFPWPAGLSPDNFTRIESTERLADGSRLKILANPPRDCTVLGFTDGFAASTYWLHYYYNTTWIQYAPLYTIGLVFGSDTVTDYISMWIDKPVLTAPYFDCARVGSINIPIIIILAYLAVVLLTSLLHIALVALRGGLQVCVSLSEKEAPAEST